MSIVVNKSAQTFTLNTSGSTYQIKIDEWGSVLHSYYGAPFAPLAASADKANTTTQQTEADSVFNADLSRNISFVDRGFSGNPSDVNAKGRRNYSFDWLPQEYSVEGNSDYRVTAMQIEREKVSSGLDLRFSSYEIIPGKYELPGLPAFYASADEADTLILTLKDRFEELYVDLFYGVYTDLPIITRAVRVRNLTGRTIKLKCLASASLDWQPQGNKQYNLLHLYGRHAGERQVEESALNHGIFSLRSTRGASSHQHNPFAVIKEVGATEEAGECFGFNFVYSGGFEFVFEKDQFDNLRAVLGLDSENFTWLLENEAEFTTPELLMTYSGAGLTSLTQSIQAAANKHLIRSKWHDCRRPVVINNWEATYFDFNDQKIAAIAKSAAEIGIDMLVLDDGWFGARDSDNAGLGDWFVNEDKINGSLAQLVATVNSYGLDFGIWFEPEMVNVDSKLYKLHPEWVFQEPGREPVFSRNQLVLDLGRDDVCTYLENSLSAILDSANIKYIKWDMNRSMENVYSANLPASRQGEARHRYMLGVYRVLEYLHVNYPDLLLEGCSGGGGRFDMGMLYYTPQIWTSDNTDALDRTIIQYGTAFAYPVSAISAHVSTVPNHQNRRVTPLKTRGITAMQGAFGYELDLSVQSEAELAEMARQVEFYKTHWELFQKGSYYRLNSAVDAAAAYNAWSFVSADKSQAFIGVVYKNVLANFPQLNITAKGLEASKVYRVKCEAEDLGQFTGAELMHMGVLLPYPQTNYDSTYLLCEEI